VKRLCLVITGLLVAVVADGLWADSFRDIGVVPFRTGGSLVSSGGDPDANLPTESMRPHPAVVRVIVPERGSTSYGSGTLVNVSGEHGLVLTNHHVISDGASPPTVLFADGFRSLARVVKTDADWDLAALVIWRPNAEPVAVATAAPRPGELLSIAGYGGQGLYRLASGRCTNYVAPNTRLPRETVELAVAARQGDSGGPIFNQRGELAGVLWGEGSGYTTGSYCGRVRQFLSGVLPPAAPSAGDQPFVAVAPRAIARQRSAGALVSTSSRIDGVNQSSGWANPKDSVISRRPETAVRQQEIDGFDQSDAKLSDRSCDWQAFAGRTRAEQSKTLLAVIGVVALALRVRRAVGRQSAA
jgi:S1-C subfamily serine protease